MPANLYVHFPFCRSKCTYCALYSRAGSSEDERKAYTLRIADEIKALTKSSFKTIYFGGGTPAICDLSPILEALQDKFTDDYEFTVELHPLDVNQALLDKLKALGVNRISMGVESLNDRTLRAMGRGYTLNEARKAYDKIRSLFNNVGIDLIVGFPGDPLNCSQLADWNLNHCSVYSLQNERRLEGVMDDESMMDALSRFSAQLESAGLKRYEISNYARPGYECRHNLAVWRGEDYLGLGEGAHGRVGLKRTVGKANGNYATEEVSAEFDRKERSLFRLRTREGIDVNDFPEWLEALERAERAGLLGKVGATYFPTPRGMEVCDAILEELV